MEMAIWHRHRRRTLAPGELKGYSLNSAAIEISGLERDDIVSIDPANDLARAPADEEVMPFWSRTRVRENGEVWVVKIY